MNDVEQPERAVAKGIVSDEGKSREIETADQDVEREGAGSRQWFWLMIILFVVVVVVIVGLALLGPAINHMYEHMFDNTLNYG